MNEAVEYWDNLFRGLDPETMDLSKSLPASVLPGFCDRNLKKGDRTTVPPTNKSDMQMMCMCSKP